jgi:hypothetical protein
MRKLLIALTAFLISTPAFAALDHWTCSNDETVLFAVLDTDNAVIHLWDDRGGFLASAKFTEKGETDTGTPFLAAELPNGAAIGIAKQGNNLILAIAKDTNSKAARFVCN